MSLTRRSFLKALFAMSAVGALPTVVARDIESELSVSSVQRGTIRSATLLSDGKWHHIMLSQSKNGSKLYFDHQEVDSIEGLTINTVEGQLFFETDAGTVLGINTSSNVQGTNLTFSTWFKQLPKSASEPLVAETLLEVA